MLISAHSAMYTVNEASRDVPRLLWYTKAIEHLLIVIQKLSLVHDQDGIIKIVKDAARELTGADGSTFVLRSDDKCYYVDENAISPLWKGKRFPMETCISGWAMLNGKSAIIPDIYADERIPADAYRPTFVKSLVMVPIRQQAPIGAIGNYWAEPHEATEEEVAILQALADTTSVALENAALYDELQSKMKSLMESNYDLSRFAWVASQDLKDSLGIIDECLKSLFHEHHDKLNENDQQQLHNAACHSSKLVDEIENLLVHARIEKMQNFRPVPLDQLIAEARRNLHSEIKEAGAKISCDDKFPWVMGDPLLLRRLLQNLLSNALKFRADERGCNIEIGAKIEGDNWCFFVRDNGIGIPVQQHEKIFRLFHRLHTQDQYAGAGISLATCRKIVEHHKGLIWVESEPQKGSTFHFTLGLKPEQPPKTR